MKQVKQDSITLDDALDLMNEMIESGGEFPDVLARVVVLSKHKAEVLIQEYDKHCASYNKGYTENV
jgi:hypothetical protein